MIPVAPCQAIPFDHNTKSNNLDFSRIFIGVDCPTVGIIWSSKPLSTASKAQVVDVSLTSESGGKKGARSSQGVLKMGGMIKREDWEYGREVIREDTVNNLNLFFFFFLFLFLSTDLTRVFKFVCVVDPQKHTNRICIRPSLVVANQTGVITDERGERRGEGRRGRRCSLLL